MARTHRDHLVHRFDSWADDLRAAHDVSSGDGKVQVQRTDVERTEAEPLSVYRAQTPPPNPTTRGAMQLGSVNGRAKVRSLTMPSRTPPRVTPLMAVERTRSELSNERQLPSAWPSPVLLNSQQKRDERPALPASPWPVLGESTDDGNEQDAKVKTRESCSVKWEAHENITRNLKSEKDNSTQNSPEQLPLATSEKYQPIMLVAIILNAAFVGFEVQYFAQQALSHAKLRHRHENHGFLVGHTVFFMIFLADFFLRWYENGLVTFFRLKDRKWNMCELVLVVLSLVELVIDLLELVGIVDIDFHGKPNISAIRALHVFRVVRLLPVIEVVTLFRNLRIMLESLLDSVKHLLSVMVVFGLIFYMFGIMFTWAVFKHCHAGSDCGGDSQDLIRYFGTLDRSAMTLFMSITGGKDWGDYFEALGDLSAMTKTVYIMYMFFAIVAAMNIVTGILVECVTRTSAKEREMELREMNRVFVVCDENGSGKIDFDELKKHLHDDKDYFSAMGFNCDDDIALLSLFHTDGTLNIPEFATWFEKLRGEARAIDLALLRNDVRNLARILTKTLDELWQAMAQMADKNTTPREVSQRDASADPNFPILLT
eukprot:TRINITY_DN4102_c0_g2_i1.p1 TRINITY_DN4102_c0_g2~~TRINITY_DN4102_c0_g2_i1.p1  ORF type:complete len:648 (-),score=86.97 TRINITY_DN4102_c0_g2_i1:163-1956(-)